MPELHARVTPAVAPLGPYEIVVVDDGSTDGTWSRLVAIAAVDPHVRLVRLSRNFGHQVALTAGVEAARGDAVVTIDGDLQDPPEVIPDMVARWQEGYDVVYGVRDVREGETRYKLWTARLFYRLIGRLSPRRDPRRGGRLPTPFARAADALRAMPERARFLRGMTSWIGFPQIGVSYGARRAERRRDEVPDPEDDPLRSRRHHHRSRPPRCGSSRRSASSWSASAGSTWRTRLYKRAFTDDTVEGWTSVIVVLLLIGGAQLIGLGVIGQYVGRIYDEAKGRPLYVVSELVDSASLALPSVPPEDLAVGGDPVESA